MVITPTTMVNVLYLLDAWSVLIKRNCNTIEKREHEGRTGRYDMTARRSIYTLELSEYRRPTTRQKIDANNLIKLA